MICRRRLFSIGGTEVSLHLATGLFVLYAVLLGYGKWLRAGMASVLLHECAHGSAAALLGCAPASIEITPLGALMRLEDEASLPPVKRLVILLAGPVATLLLCWGALMLTRCGLLDRYSGQLLFMANVSILLVNLLPALPLDGGRVLALLFSLFLTGNMVRCVMRWLGMALGVGCVVWNIVLCWTAGGANLSLTCAGCFLLYAASTGTATAALSELRGFMERKLRLERRGRLRCRVVAVMEPLSLRNAVSALDPSQYTLFLVVQPGTMRCLGYATEEQVISSYMNTPGETCAVLSLHSGHGQKETRYAD